MFAFLQGLLSKAPRAAARRSASRPLPRAGRRLVLQGLEERAVPSASPGSPEPEYYSTSNNDTSGYGNSGYSWPRSSDGYFHITYSYYNVLGGQLNGLSASTVKEVIQEALALWADYIPVIFTEVSDSGVNNTTGQEYSGSGSANIRFGCTSIDGVNNVLAYTYYPNSVYSGLAGDVIFDSAEKWATNPRQGTDLLEVALHEIGHALGLGHSHDSSAIMYPYYAGRFQGLGTGYLTSNDVANVQSIYGAGSGALSPLATLDRVAGNSGGGSSPYFSVSGDTLYVYGTSGNDTAYYYGGASSQTVIIDGQSRTVSSSSIKHVVFIGYGGTDTIYVVGTGDTDTLVEAPGYGSLTGRGYDASWTGFERVYGYGQGGNDAAYFLDSAGSDAFVSYPGSAYMTGPGYWNFAAGFRSNVAYSCNGGSDTAYFVGSSGNDVYVSYPNTAYLYGSGYLNYASGFTTTVAYGQGGSDTAYFVDGAGSNVFVVGQGYSYMYGSNYLNVSFGFGTSLGLALYGSSDTAYFFGSNADDAAYAEGAYAYFYGHGYTGIGYGFSNVYLFGYGGSNHLYNYGVSYSLSTDGSWN